MLGEMTSSAHDLDGLRLMLDLDSTLYPLLDAIGSLPGGERVNYRDCMTWTHLVELCGGVPQLLRLFAASMSLETMRRFPAFPGAAAWTSEAQRRGARVHIVTDRPAELRESTLQWLRENGFQPDSFYCLPDLDKLALIEQEGLRVNVLVDDHPDLLARAHQAGLAALSLRWPYNCEVLDRLSLPHADDWRELGPLIEQRFQALKH